MDEDPIRSAIGEHENLRHMTLLEREEIERMDAKGLELIGLIADEMLGPRRGPLWGEERNSKIGLKADVESLTAWKDSVQKMLENGGVPSKLASKDRATVVAAALGSVSAVILGLIQLFGGNL